MNAEAHPADAFEPHRRFLFGLAYRLLGSVAEAEDAVQDAYLRWHQQSGPVENPRAWLARVVTRLCLDRLKSARAQREVYIGPWLPEPLVEPQATAASELADDLSVALMLTLERLSPLERAAFLLHDVFDQSFTEVALTLGRTEAACRQLASRARVRVKQEGTRFQPTPDQEQALIAAFTGALTTGDTAGLMQVLTPDALWLADGGGQVPSALQPVKGADRIARMLVGLMQKSPVPPGTQVRPVRVNGLAGLLLSDANGRAFQTVAFEIAAGRIAAIYVVRNPQKLRHLDANA